MSYHVYVGPYLVVPFQDSVKDHITQYCANHCNQPRVGNGAKFCSNCGGAIKSFTEHHREAAPLNIYKMADKWTDFMYSPSRCSSHPQGSIWIPNKAESPGRHIEVTQFIETECAIPLSSIQSDEQLAVATAMYAEFVQAIRDDFQLEPFWEMGIIVVSL